MSDDEPKRAQRVRKRAMLMSPGDGQTNGYESIPRICEDAEKKKNLSKQLEAMTKEKTSRESNPGQQRLENRTSLEESSATDSGRSSSLSKTSRHSSSLDSIDSHSKSPEREKELQPSSTSSSTPHRGAITNAADMEVVRRVRRKKKLQFDFEADNQSSKRGKYSSTSETETSNRPSSQSSTLSVELTSETKYLMKRKPAKKAHQIEDSESSNKKQNLETSAHEESGAASMNQDAHSRTDGGEGHTERPAKFKKRAKPETPEEDAQEDSKESAALIEIHDQDSNSVAEQQDGLVSPSIESEEKTTNGVAQTSEIESVSQPSPELDLLFQDTNVLAFNQPETISTEIAPSASTLAPLNQLSSTKKGIKRRGPDKEMAELMASMEPLISTRKTRNSWSNSIPREILVNIEEVEKENAILTLQKEKAIKKAEINKAEASSTRDESESRDPTECEQGSIDYESEQERIGSGSEQQSIDYESDQEDNEERFGCSDFSDRPSSAEVSESPTDNQTLMIDAQLLEERLYLLEQWANAQQTKSTYSTIDSLQAHPVAEEEIDRARILREVEELDRAIQLSLISTATSRGVDETAPPKSGRRTGFKTNKPLLHPNDKDHHSQAPSLLEDQSAYDSDSIDSANGEKVKSRGNTPPPVLERMDSITTSSSDEIPPLQVINSGESSRNLSYSPELGEPYVRSQMNGRFQGDREPSPALRRSARTKKSPPIDSMINCETKPERKSSQESQSEGSEASNGSLTNHNTEPQPREEIRGEPISMPTRRSQRILEQAQSPNKPEIVKNYAELAAVIPDYYPIKYADIEDDRDALEWDRAEENFFYGQQEGFRSYLEVAKKCHFPLNEALHYLHYHCCHYLPEAIETLPDRAAECPNPSPPFTSNEAADFFVNYCQHGKKFNLYEMKNRTLMEIIKYYYDSKKEAKYKKMKPKALRQKTFQLYSRAPKQGVCERCDKFSQKIKKLNGVLFCTKCKRIMRKRIEKMMKIEEIQENFKITADKENRLPIAPRTEDALPNLNLSELSEEGLTDGETKYLAKKEASTRRIRNLFNEERRIFAERNIRKSAKLTIEGFSTIKTKKSSQWSDVEAVTLINAANVYTKDFGKISTAVGNKTPGECKAYYKKHFKNLCTDLPKIKEEPLSDREASFAEFKKRTRSYSPSSKGKHN